MCNTIPCRVVLTAFTAQKFTTNVESPFSRKVNYGITFVFYPGLPHTYIYIYIGRALHTGSRNENNIDAAAPRTRITWAPFLDSGEPSLKLLRLAELQHTNSN